MPSLKELGKLALDYGPSLIGPVTSGIIQRSAAGSATNKLDEGAARAEAVIKPYSDIGATALAKLPNFGIEEMLQDPGVKFRVNEGQKLFARKQANTGSLNSGAAWKAMERYKGDLLNQEFNAAWNRNMQQVAIGQEGSRQLVDLMTARASALAAGDIAKANALTDMISGIQKGITGVQDKNLLEKILAAGGNILTDDRFKRLPIPGMEDVGGIGSDEGGLTNGSTTRTRFPDMGPGRYPMDEKTGIPEIDNPSPLPDWLQKALGGIGAISGIGGLAGLGGGTGVGVGTATTFPNVLNAAATAGATGGVGIGSTAAAVGSKVGTLGGLVPLAAGIPIIGGAIAAAILLPKLFGNGPDRMAANELTAPGGLHTYVQQGVNALKADTSMTPEQKAEAGEAIARQVESFLVEFSKKDKDHYYQAQRTLRDFGWLGVQPLLG